MARRKRGAGGRIFMLLLLILLMLAGGVLLFDILGVIDSRQALYPVMEFFGLVSRPQPVNAEDPWLLDKERLIKREEALYLYSDELASKDQDIIKKEEEVLQMVNTLAEKEKAQEEREKAFNEIVNRYDNKKANLEQAARYLVGMEPANSVKILLEMDTQDAIELLRVVEEQALAAGEDSIVSYWLSLLPAEKAAEIQRKMVRTPGA